MTRDPMAMSRQEQARLRSSSRAALRPKYARPMSPLDVPNGWLSQLRMEVQGVALAPFGRPLMTDGSIAELELVPTNEIRKKNELGEVKKSKRRPARTLRMSRPQKGAGRPKGQTTGGSRPSPRGQSELPKGQRRKERPRLGGVLLDDVKDSGLTKRSIDDPKKNPNDAARRIEKIAKTDRKKEQRKRRKQKGSPRLG